MGDLTRRCAWAALLAGTAAAAVPAWAARARKAAAPAGKTYTIRMADLGFGPAPQGLKVGDTIEWVNADTFEHTATARDGSFDVDLKPGARGKTVLKAAGAIAFYCKYHPGMTGTLAVGK